jgi:NTE family protein
MTTSAHTVALALQGGGAHGAFTWGVLDRLLEEGLTPDAICGVSSGAIIGTMLAQGLVCVGRSWPSYAKSSSISQAIGPM